MISYLIFNLQLLCAVDSASESPTHNAEKDENSISFLGSTILINLFFFANHFRQQAVISLPGLDIYIKPSAPRHSFKFKASLVVFYYECIVRLFKTYIFNTCLWQLNWHKLS